MHNPSFIILASLLCVVFMGLSPSRAEEPTWRPARIEIVDIPTADVVDHYGYNVSFRFFKEGGIQTKTTFGIFPRLNLGFGMDAERLIGVSDSRLNKPTLNVKFRIFNGHQALPAVAIGFDGQGYNFNKLLDEYEQREKGLYLSATKEIIIPNLVFTAGVNHFDFDRGNSTRGYFGMSYTYQQLLGGMVEWDHATEYKERRINFGIRYFITPVFTIDLMGRNVPVGAFVKNRETERVLRLAYTGSF